MFLQEFTEENRRVEVKVAPKQNQILSFYDTNSCNLYRVKVQDNT